MRQVRIAGQCSACSRWADDLWPAGRVDGRRQYVCPRCYVSTGSDLVVGSGILAFGLVILVFLVWRWF